jgi:hypothetical protein
MGDGVTRAGNAPPASQTTNAGQSGATSAADAAKFGETLKQESLCPPGLGRPPHVGSFPPRYDPKCHYLRDPSQPSKPADLQVHGDIPNLLKGPTNDPNGPDYKKSIPAERDPNPLHGVKPPKGAPSHDEGLSKDGHIIMVPLKGTPREESPDQTPYKPPR